MKTQDARQKKTIVTMRVVFVSLLVSLFGGLFASGCFKKQVPQQAQLLCDEDDDRCPDGWSCCGGQCEEGHCLCEHGRCDTDYAVDCQQGRICSAGCWQDCPTCLDSCQDRSLKKCSLDKVQGVWFCRKAETCMLREDLHGGQIADCLSPSPFCTGSEASSCACLDSSTAFYPPCASGERCEDRSSICVACAQAEPDVPGDAEPSGDAGISVGVSDAGELIAEDAGSAGSYADAGDGTGNGVGGDGAAPACFRAIGDSPLGKSCCDVFAVEAVWQDNGWVCPDGAIFAPQCDSFGSGCLSDEAPLCDMSNSCLWRLPSSDGQTHCASFGPAEVPCLDHAWQCYSGTLLSSACDVIE